MLLAAFAAFFTLSSFVSNSSAAGPSFNSVESMEMDGSVFNDCTNEFVDYSGTAHANIFGMFRANRIFVNYHIQYSFTGVGRNSGKIYHANMQDTYSESSSFRGAYKLRASSKGKFMTSGAKNNFTTTASSQLSINSRGEVRVSVEDLALVTCQ